MSTTVRAYYKTGFGLAGCYLDDSQGGAQCFTTRAQLASAIRYELESAGFPASLFREVKLRRLWRVICNARSASSLTFYLQHGAHVVTFYGLTEAEFLEARATDDDADPDDVAAWEAYQRA